MVFSALQVLLSHLWEKGKGGERKKIMEGGKKGIEKERKEGRRNNKRKDRKEEEIQGERKKAEKKKKKSSAGFKPVRLVLLVFLSVEQEEVVGRICFPFLPS